MSINVYNAYQVYVYSSSNSTIRIGGDCYLKRAASISGTLIFDGTATILITGIGNYTGTKTARFTICCGRDYDIVDVKSTCYQHGHMKKTCKTCGYSIEYDYDEIFTDSLPQSTHNYANSTNITYSYKVAGAESLYLVFSDKTKVESNYDFIYIYDINDNQIGKYTGTALASQIINVPGDTVKIKITSDGSVTYYGFALDVITAMYSYDKLATDYHMNCEWNTIKKPTINECGLKQKYCKYCEQVLAEESIPKLVYYGDGNFDGIINALDLVQLRITLLTTISNVEYYECYDVNSDGEINIIDLVRLKKILVSVDAPIGASDKTQTSTVELLSQPAYLEQKNTII